MSMNAPFGVEDLQYDTVDFDPAGLRCKHQLTGKLGLSSNARIETLSGNTGGLNQGMWTMSDSAKTLMLKLVRAQRRHPSMPTETEKFMKLARECPNLVHDRDLSFPSKIFRCRGPSGHNTHDLIVMFKAPGQSFTNVINNKCCTRQIPELMEIFEALGSFLANIHNKYGLRHGDFQPSNVFYDEATRHFTMIDIADFAPPGNFGVQESDVEHFCSGVRLLTRMHGEQIQCEGLHRFKAGYSKCRHG